ncbi:TPA: methionine synthase [Candidatus Delongbacteria bacterium]|nr:methionine synthase [Candidatus Delongbacteria bacterium]
MKNIEKLIRDKILVTDGGMGSGIMRFGLTKDDYHGHFGCHEYLVLSRPDVIGSIHASFIKAGADIIETDTFGANPVNLDTFGMADKTYEINVAAAKLARKAVEDNSPKHTGFVSGSIGPGAKLPSLGHTTFDILKDSYKQQALGLIDGGVDLFQIETCQDMLQAKAAYSGVRSAMTERKKKLPVIIQITLEKNGRMLLGTDLSAVITAFSAYDLFALGMNCGTGPESMYEAVKFMSERNPFYCSVLPNAGLPEIVNGKAVYSMLPELFASHLSRFVSENGIEIVGGCCGTQSEHIQAVSEAVGRIEVKNRKRPDIIPGSASLYKSQFYDINPKPLIIGERTNVSGSSKFREAFLNENYDAMTETALDQEKEGAHLLDLSLAYAGKNEVKITEEMVHRLAIDLKIPLCIDSTNPEVIEAALKNYGGKMLINSINLEDGGIKAAKVLDLAKEYGASVVALTIDEQGMAKTLERKIEAAERLLELTRSKGIPDGDVFIDTLTFTLGSGDLTLKNAGVETLNAIRKIKEMHPGVNMILGVSNISYGLNDKIRKVINSLFLFHAVEAGLDAAIFHAGKVVPLNNLSENIRKLSDDLIFNRGTADYEPLEELIRSQETTKAASSSETEAELTLEEKIIKNITEGRKTGLKELIEKALEKYEPLQIIDRFILEGMKRVGEDFEKGTLQLPFVLKSAEAVKFASSLLAEHHDSAEIRYKASVVLATVKGDVHDIGKNLTDIILSNYGYRVHNIGIDCTAQTIADEVIKSGADYIGLSGLLVSSAEEMKNVVSHFNSRRINKHVFCGGAALSQPFVRASLSPVYDGIVTYVKDAFGLINIIEGQKSAKEKPDDEPKTEAKANEHLNIRNTYKKPVRPFTGVKKISGLSISEIGPFINKNRLIKVKWAEKDPAKGENLYSEFIKRSSELKFDILYGYFSLKESGLNFARGSSPSSPSMYDLVKEDDFTAVFLVTSGKKAVEIAQELYKKDEFGAYYQWHGFAAEITEALAEYVNRKITEELGINKDQGKRYSPGYSVWPDLAEQKKVCSLLGSDSIGVALTENNQMTPEFSVSGIFVYHPDADYFTLR